MAEQLSGVNGNIIRWAREFYNMSPEEAARSIGVSTEKYSAWESGAEFPTYAKLKKRDRRKVCVKVNNRLPFKQ